MDLVASPQIWTEAGAFHLVNPHDQDSINRIFREKPSTLPYALKSGERVLMSTIAIVSVPMEHIGIIGLRSTWARLGLVAPTTFARPGFTGTLTMEVFNASKHHILISIGDVIWEYNEVPVINEAPYNGVYQNQSGITLPKALS